MSFVLYDLVFLALFTLAVVVFLYIKRHNLKREGLLYLYRTRLGMRFIESTNKKCSKFLKPIQYIILVCGYTLLVSIIYILIKFAYFYLTSPTAAKALKMPVIMPLIPYLPDIFKIDYLPPFYFTYWIIIIAIIAIPHEFAHGIFARLNKIRILSTGFGFLGPFLAAFVEQDDKQMQKSSKFSQLVVLAAGTFANVLTAVLFALLMWLFFASAFVPAGIMFNTYSFDMVNTSQMSNLNNITLNNMSLVQFQIGNNTYFTSPAALNDSKNIGSLTAYDDAPAFKNQLAGAIISIDGKKITSYNSLNETLSNYKPGDNVTVKTLNSKNNIQTYSLTLAEKKGKAYLGIGAFVAKKSGVFGFVYSFIEKIRDPLVFYQSRIGDFGIFILNLLWWIVLVSISVALMNMVPAGIFDGGRFFYLTIWGITGSEKIAKRAFSASTWILIVLVAALLLKWVWAFTI